MLIGLGAELPRRSVRARVPRTLDFASVQRAIPRSSAVRRKSSTVARPRHDNPILLIHDVGAGGLSNAVPESVAHGGCGVVSTCASAERRARMSPLEIWCNEAQERYVLIVARTGWSSSARCAIASAVRTR